MSDEQNPPGEITERFRAFARSADPAPSRIPRVALLVVAMIVVLAATAIVVTMTLRVALAG